MAQTAEVKAQVIASLLSGDTVLEAHRRHGVSLSTVNRWNAELVSKGKLTLSSAVGKTNLLQNLLEEFMVDSLKMVSTWAKVAGDEEWVRKYPIEANELGRTVLERADKLSDYLRVERPESD